MSGPMQWTQNGMVPVGVVPSGDVQPGFVAGSVQDDEDEAPTPANLLQRVSKPIRKPAPAPKNVVQLAKQRLAEVKKELRRMKALEKERDQLQRLVEAAENKPRAVVRELKRSAG